MVKAAFQYLSWSRSHCTRPFFISIYSLLTWQYALISRWRMQCTRLQTNCFLWIELHPEAVCRAWERPRIIGRKNEKKISVRGIKGLPIISREDDLTDQNENIQSTGFIREWLRRWVNPRSCQKNSNEEKYKVAKAYEEHQCTGMQRLAFYKAPYFSGYYLSFLTTLLHY